MSSNTSRYVQRVDPTLSDEEIVEARAFLNSHEFHRGPSPESIQNRVERAIDEFEYFSTKGCRGRSVFR